MDRNTAQMAIKFMQRTQLAGSEVPAFCQVLAALDEIANKQDDSVPNVTEEVKK